MRPLNFDLITSEMGSVRFSDTTGLCELRGEGRGRTGLAGRRQGDNSSSDERGGGVTKAKKSEILDSVTYNDAKLVEVTYDDVKLNDVTCEVVTLYEVTCAYDIYDDATCH